MCVCVCVCVCVCTGGVKVDDMAMLRAHNVDREALVCNITRAFAHQIFCDGFYSADPHPGNILVDRLGG